MIRKGIIGLLCFVGCLTLVQGQATIWPGDCNVNGQANNIDWLFIGLGFGQSGPPRNPVDQTITWGNYVNNQIWGQTTVSGVNFVHLDADGNGTVGSADDFNAVDVNYGLIHGNITPDPYFTGAVVDPPLALVSQNDTIAAGDTLWVEVVLGSAQRPVDSLYGLAFSMSFDTALVSEIFGDFRNSWIAGVGFALPFVSHTYADSGLYEVGLTRFDGANVAGYGTIGSVGIVMDDNLKRAASVQDLGLGVTKIYAHTFSESRVPLFPKNDTIAVLSGREQPVPADFVVYPNPVSEVCWVETGRWNLSGGMELLDLQGRVVKRWQPAPGGRQRLELAGVPSGIFVLRLPFLQGVVRKKLWVRNPDF